MCCVYIKASEQYKQQGGNIIGKSEMEPKLDGVVGIHKQPFRRNAISIITGERMLSLFWANRVLL